MSRSVIVRESFFVVGIGALTVGQTYSLDDSLAALMVNGRKAVYASSISRPYIGSFGDSITSQDAANAEGSPNGVSPMFWANALMLGACDQMRPNTSTFTPSGGSQVGLTTFSHGVCGSSGALIMQHSKYSIDQYLALMVAAAGGRPFVVLLTGGINDFANNDVANYDSTVWPEYYAIIQKVIAAGGLPVLKCGEPSVSNDTLVKRRNVAAFSERVMAFAAGRRDCAALDVRAAYERYAGGLPHERMTRGTTGDEVHPNSIGAVIYGLGYADALAPLLEFSPPWERPDFIDPIIGTLYKFDGTGGTKSTGADAASVVPTSWTLTSFGANTNALTSKGTFGNGPGVFMDLTAIGTPVADNVGLNTPAQTVDSGGSTYYRAFADMDVFQADYARSIHIAARRDSTNYSFAPVTGSSDLRAMTATYPNHVKLLVGRRVVLQTFPFQFPAASSGAMYQAGGGGGLDTSASARLRTFTRFAGLLVS